MPTRLSPSCLRISVVDNDMDYCPYCGKEYPGSHAAAPAKPTKSDDIMNTMLSWTCLAYTIAFLVAVSLVLLIWWLSTVPLPG